MGLELALESGIDILAVYGDSQLIIKQMNFEYEMRKPIPVPYFNKVQKLKSQFTLIEFHHVPRYENVKADALAGLVASMALPKNDKVTITIIEQKLLPPLDTHQAIADCFKSQEAKLFPMKIRLENGESPSLITSYMVFYPMTSRIELAFKGMHPDSIMIFHLKLYIEGHLMEFCCGAYLKWKQKLC